MMIARSESEQTTISCGLAAILFKDANRALGVA